MTSTLKLHNCFFEQKKMKQEGEKAISDSFTFVALDEKSLYNYLLIRHKNNFPPVIEAFLKQSPRELSENCHNIIQSPLFCNTFVKPV